MTTGCSCSINLCNLRNLNLNFLNSKVSTSINNTVHQPMTNLGANDANLSQPNVNNLITFSLSIACMRHHCLIFERGNNHVGSSCSWFSTTYVASWFDMSCVVVALVSMCKIWVVVVTTLPCHSTPTIFC